MFDSSPTKCASPQCIGLYAVRYTPLRWLSSGNLDHIPAECVDGFPKVKALKEKMEAEPAVAAYIESLRK